MIKPVKCKFNSERGTSTNRTVPDAAAGVALAIAFYSTDTATGFTVGAFILAAISTYLAFLALVVATTRKSEGGNK